MASDFSNLKKSKNQAKARLQKKLEEPKTGGNKKSYEDDRFWFPTLEKDGTGYAVIRFLPDAKEEDMEYVRVFNHGFKGPSGRWFIESCPTTIGEKCPVCAANSELWNSGSDDNKSIARDRKRKVQYISNIYVVKDPSNPENEGKVFLYRYGTKIFEKITSLMSPEYEDEEEVNPFDMWEGCNFKLKIRKVAGYTNYDKSEFDSSSEIVESDEEKEKIWLQQHKLAEFIAPENFKTYTEMKERFDSIWKGESVSETEEPTYSAEPSETPKTSVTQTNRPTRPSEEDDVELDEDLAIFAEMAEN